MDRESGLKLFQYSPIFPKLIYAQNSLQLNIFHSIPKNLPPNLQTLILSNSRIESIGNVSNLKHLKKLDLSNNFIQNINFLTNNKKLEDLDLSMNLIERATNPAANFNLRTIDLRYNFIRKIAHRSWQTFGTTWHECITLSRPF